MNCPSWPMAHPWMTFWLFVLAILVLDNVAGNILRVRRK